MCGVTKYLPDLTASNDVTHGGILQLALHLLGCITITAVLTHQRNLQNKLTTKSCKLSAQIASL